MVSNKLANYLSLLMIRQTAKRRDTIISGGVFMISFIALIAFAMLDQLTGRSLILTSAIVVCFGFAYLSIWVKLEIIKGTIELLNNLQLLKEG